MTTVRRRFDAHPDDVFAALADPETYPRWLIGAKRIRHVDDAWPAPGARFEHEVGVAGPLTVEDESVSRDVGPGRRLQLEVRFRPIGRAMVRFDVRAADRGAEVVLDEEPIGWLALLSWLVGPLVALRNRASLARLAAQLRPASA